MSKIPPVPEIRSRLDRVILDLTDFDRLSDANQILGCRHYEACCGMFLESDLIAGVDTSIFLLETKDTSF